MIVAEQEEGFDLEKYKTRNLFEFDLFAMNVNQTYFLYEKPKIFAF